MIENISKKAQSGCLAIPLEELKKRMKSIRKKCVGCVTVMPSANGSYLFGRDGKSVINQMNVLMFYMLRVCRNEGYRPWFIREFEGPLHVPMDI